ncbi:MAG: 6-pyruvoyl-tetrahydropterin synthase-related protein, partial [Caldilinea sp.]
MRPTRSWVTSRGVLWGVLALLALPALWPLLSEGFPKTHDGSVHLIRLSLLDEQVRSGNFFPRRLPSLMTGYGYPTFNFYAPFIYGVAELWHLAGVALPSALALLMGGLVLVAGAGMFLLASDLYADHGPAGRWAGLAAAGVYLYTPYFLVNLYVRGALAELLAQALLPWLFWAVTRVWTRPRPQLYWVGSAVLLGGIAIGHNITLLLLPLLLGPYGVTLLAVLPGDRREFFRRAGGLAAGALVAAGITAFFWLPLLWERSLLSSLAFNAPNLAEHVWSWGTVVEPTLPYAYPFSSVPFRLGLVQAVLALAGLLWTRRRSPLWWFWVVLGAVAALGITPASLLLWENVDLLRVVQFPWRLLTAVSLSTAILAGGLVLLGRRRSVQVLLASAIALAALLAGRPYVATFDTAMYADIAVDPAVIARYEAIYRAWGAGWHREFLP